MTFRVVGVILEGGKSDTPDLTKDLARTKRFFRIRPDLSGSNGSRSRRTSYSQQGLVDHKSARQGFRPKGLVSVNQARQLGVHQKW